MIKFKRTKLYILYEVNHLDDFIWLQVREMYDTMVFPLFWEMMICILVIDLLSKHCKHKDKSTFSNTAIVWGQHGTSVYLFNIASDVNFGYKLFDHLIPPLLWIFIVVLFLAACMLIPVWKKSSTRISSNRQLQICS